MTIVTEEELLKEFDAIVRNLDEDILFYLYEYRYIMPVDDMAMYLVRTFKNRVWSLAEEILEEEERAKKED